MAWLRYELNAIALTLMQTETIRTTKHGQIRNKQPGVRGEIKFVRNLLGVTV